MQTQSSEGAWSTSSGAGEHGCGPRHEGVPAGVLGSLAPDLVWLRRFERTTESGRRAARERALEDGG